ncbi:MAG: OmpA family protein [Myxococcota bacterium]
MSIDQRDRGAPPITHVRGFVRGVTAVPLESERARVVVPSAPLPSPPDAPPAKRPPVALAAALVCMGALLGAGAALVSLAEAPPAPPEPVVAAAAVAPAPTPPAAAPAPERKPRERPVWSIAFPFRSVEAPRGLAMPDWLRTCGQIEVVGHTCSVGDPESNHLVGLGRAHAIRDRLVAAGFPPSRIDVRSAGADEPAAMGTTPDALKANRRATVRCAER